MIRSCRAFRALPLLATVLVGSFLAAPRTCRAAAEIIATRLAPSSLAAQYGPPVALRPGLAGGAFVAPARTGIEVRSSADGTLYGSFRTAGAVGEVAVSGNTGYLLAGAQGIVAVDLADSTSLTAIGGDDHLGPIQHGAFAPASGVLAVSSDSTLHFLRETGAGVLSLIQTRRYTGRAILRVRARSDSFLVLATIPIATQRLIVTMYRCRAGALPESLWEFQANGVGPLDLAWPDAVAFIAAGNAGIVPFHTGTRTLGSPVLVTGASYVRCVDADSASVVAAGESRAYSRFVRGGTAGETLGGEVNTLTALEPLHLSLVGGRTILAEDELAAPTDPDEAGTSTLEIFDPAQPGTSTTATIGTGRARRVVASEGLVYLADYTGGLRIYRGASADTSLVGVFPMSGTARVYDLALDPVRHRVYLAAGTAGLLEVSVADPAAPSEVASVVFPGLTSCVALRDTSLIVVGRRGLFGAGVTFLDASDPIFPPVARGSVNGGFVGDPRAIALRDTIAFVADALSGLYSIRFGNLDAPDFLGISSGSPATDLDLTGSILLVGTRTAGVQVVDVFRPASPSLIATLPAPPVFGVGRQGETGVALLGDQGAITIDLRSPTTPRARGPIAVPGFARDAAWMGDTLWIAESFGLERFRASPLVTVDPALALQADAAAAIPRVTISWTVPLPAGAIGWNVYRDRGSAAQGYPGDLGADWAVRVNDALLPPSTQTVVDVGMAPGFTYRYRLDAFFPDGSSRKAAEGAVLLGSNSALGILYPNPYRPRGGATLQIPYRVLSVDAGRLVQLRVFDPGGRLMRRIDGVAPAAGGFGSFTWDGRDERGRRLADGVYFVRVTGPGIDDARQLILLR